MQSTRQLLQRTVRQAASRPAASKWATATGTARTRANATPSAIRQLSSTARKDEASPSSLLTEHAAPEAEGEAVNRIDSLLKLTDRLSRQSRNAALPLNLRAQGSYVKGEPALPVMAEDEELVPLPETRRMGGQSDQVRSLPEAVHAIQTSRDVGVHGNSHAKTSELTGILPSRLLRSARLAILDRRRAAGTIRRRTVQSAPRPPHGRL